MIRITIVCLLAIFVAWFAFGKRSCNGCSFKNSSEIVASLKGHARDSNEVIALAQLFGKDYYLLAEGTWYGSGVWDQELFPKTKVIYEELGDSEGYWFIITKIRNDELAIYAINQIDIAWWPLKKDLPKTAYRPQYLTIKQPRADLPFTIVKMDQTNLPIKQPR